MLAPRREVSVSYPNMPEIPLPLWRFPAESALNLCRGCTHLDLSTGTAISLPLSAASALVHPFCFFLFYTHHNARTHLNFQDVYFTQFRMLFCCSTTPSRGGREGAWLVSTFSSTVLHSSLGPIPPPPSARPTFVRIRPEQILALVRGDPVSRIFSKYICDGVGRRGCRRTDQVLRRVRHPGEHKKPTSKKCTMYNTVL